MIQKIKAKYKFIGISLTVISFVYIAFIIRNYDLNFEEIRNASTTSFFSIFIITPVLCAISIFISSVIWKNILDVISLKQTKQFEITEVYLKSNISKYLPGNVMQFASRNFLGIKFGWGQKEIAFSSILEIILSSCFTLIIFLIFIVLGMRTNNLINFNSFFSLRNICIFVSIILILGIVIIVIGKMRVQVFSVFSKIKLRSFLLFIVKYFLLSLFSFLISSIIIIWIFYLSTDILLNFANIINIIGASVIAYFAGYIAIGSPAGIGVRESVMIMMLTPLCSPGSVIIALVLIRFTGILGDILAYFAAVAINILSQKKIITI